MIDVYELFLELVERHSLDKVLIHLLKLEVNDIISNNIEDEKRIQHILDILFELCYDDSALLLYRRLCKHYLNINPEATAFYIHFYANTYDPERKKFGHKNDTDN